MLNDDANVGGNAVSGDNSLRLIVRLTTTHVIGELILQVRPDFLTVFISRTWRRT